MFVCAVLLAAEDLCMSVGRGAKIMPRANLYVSSDIDSLYVKLLLRGAKLYNSYFVV